MSIKEPTLTRFSPIVLIGLLVAVATAGSEHTVRTESVDAGGERTKSGSFRLAGTIGQPDAVKLQGGAFTLHGGLWPSVEPEQPIFTDGFESGDLCNWSRVVGAPPCSGAFHPGLEN